MFSCSKQVENDFGYQIEEVIGKNIETLFPKRLRKQHRKHIKAFFLEPKERRMGVGTDLVALHKDCSEFPVEFSLSPIETKEGMMVTTAIRDITFRKQAEEELIKHRENLEELVAERTKKLQDEIKARKKAEEKLSTTREYLDTILLNMPAGLAILSGPEFIYTKINHELADISGIPLEEHLGRPLAEVLPNAAKDIVPVLQNVMDKGEAPPRREFSTRLPKNPDEIRHFIDSFFPIKGADGKVKAVGVVVLDIGERIRAEEALKQSEQRFKLAVQGSNDGMWDWPDVTADDEWWSPQWYKLLGYQDGELEASLSNFNAFLHPDDLEKVKENVRAHFEERVPYDLEYRLKTKSGEYRWFRGRGQALWDDESNPVRMSGSIQDVTERKQIEMELEHNRILFQTVMDESNQVIFIKKEVDLSHVWMSKKFEQAVGVSRSEAQGKTNRELFGAKTGAMFDATDREVLAGKRIDLEESPDGKHTYWSQKFSIELPNGNTYLCGIATDITQRKKMEEALREANENLEHRVEERTNELQKTLDSLVESEERYHVLFEEARDGIILIDAETGQIKNCNKELENQTDRQREQLVEMKIWELRPKGEIEEARKLFFKIRNEKILKPREARFQTPDGEIVDVEFAAKEIMLDERRYLLSITRDITERKLAEVERQKAYAEIQGLKEQLQAEATYLRQEIKTEHDFHEIIGNSDDLLYVLNRVEKIAPTDTNVLILGETGTGKELFARAIHDKSRRKNSAFVKINCATLPRDLIESELFGHEKGAFTGALTLRRGRFELAKGGTIFLDEIGELPLELQPKLLRVLQEGEFERLGSESTQKIDVRVIAATNRDLNREISEGRFRQDLFYRLDVFPITVPPLRDRRDDLVVLTEYFIRKFSKKLGKQMDRITQTAMATLKNYHWPGNVRELENIIERAMIASIGSELRLADDLRPPKVKEVLPYIEQTLEEVERKHITRTLEKVNWRIEGDAGAAKILGMHPSTLRNRLLKLKIVRSKTADQSS